MKQSRRELLKAAAIVPGAVVASNIPEAKAAPPKVTGTIYFVCAECEDNYPEGSCYPRDMLRVMPDGKWVCQTCYEDAPRWTFVKEPPLPDADEWDEPEQPHWSEFPMPPEFAPKVG